MLGPELLDRTKPRPDLHTLHRVDAHHHLGDVRVKASVERLAPARGHAARYDIEPSAARIARLAKLVHEGFELRDDGGVGREEDVGVHGVPALEVELVGAE